MQNVTCQDQNATCQDLNARILAARDQLAKLKASVDSWASHSAYLDALMAASDVLAMAQWDARNHISEALALADQLDAVPDTGADPDLICDAAASLRLLCCLLDVRGTATADMDAPSAASAAGAVLPPSPHGNHGDNQQ